MQDSIRTIQLIMDSANAGRGRELTPTQVEHVARYVMTYERASEELWQKLEISDALLAAYINEYGAELLSELTEVVDGEVVSEDEGLSDEVLRLDAQEEE